MDALEHAIELIREKVDEWLFGPIQTQLVRLVFAGITGFQIANGLQIPPLFDTYSHAMEMVWRWDFVITCAMLFIYVVFHPCKSFEYLRERLERVLYGKPR